MINNISQVKDAYVKLGFMQQFTRQDYQQLYQAPKQSHKGNNGRLLVIGGSQLFHASIFWTADVASRVVDLVHFCSPAVENNDLIRIKAKEKFWEGIVIDWKDIDKYIQEDDCIVIGPGMPRPDGLTAGERPTSDIVNNLVDKFPQKKWVIDGGALQEIDPLLLNEKMIITPHLGEWKRLLDKISNIKYQISNISIDKVVPIVKEVSKRLSNVTIMLKGIEGKDIVCQNDQVFVVIGGNEGLTKGGTGDILAGLTGAFYCKNQAVISAASASLVLKTTADSLHNQVGPYYNSSDIVKKIPETLYGLFDTKTK